jgi:MOSC domain-containing protein YiiM
MSLVVQPLDQCEQCGFDGSEWNDQDTIKTIQHAPGLLELWAAALAADLHNTRPEPAVWSVAEYADHIRETLFGMRFIIDLALSDPVADLGPVPPPSEPGDHRSLNFAASVEAVRTESEALQQTLNRLTADEWSRAVVLDGKQHTTTWASRHAVHDLWHHLTDIARIVTSLGAGVTAQRGTVDQISLSGGGVPKMDVRSAGIGRAGVIGDRQNARVHHGRPWQALCLWSTEVIADLAAEGHSIYPGAAGENITISGIDWPLLGAGTIVQIGDMTCQISAPAVPCSKNDRWFSDNDSQRMSFDRHPEITRWYASVLTPGMITTGDQVIVRSPAAG